MDAMSLLSTPFTACPSPSVSMIARSSKYAYFVRWWLASQVFMLKRRGARMDHRNLLRLRLLMVRVKLRLPTRSTNMQTMCLLGSNRSS